MVLFIKFFNTFHEYLIQYSLNSGGTKDHLRKKVKYLVLPEIVSPDRQQTNNILNAVYIPYKVKHHSHYMHISVGMKLRLLPTLNCPVI